MKIGAITLLKQDIYNFVTAYSEGISVKEINAKFTNIPRGTISNRLSNMVDEGLLERPKRGVYKATDRIVITVTGSVNIVLYKCGPIYLIIIK